MVGKAQPKELVDEISQRIQDIAFAGGTRLDPSDFRSAHLLRDIERLQSQDAVNASILKSEFYALAGMRGRALYWADNAGAVASKPGLKARARCGVLTLMGYPHEAAELFDEAVENRDGVPIHEFLRSAFSFGWFSRVVRLVAQCREQNLVHTGVQCIDVAATAAAALESRRISEAEVNDILAELHQILREANLLWQGDTPEVNVIDVGTGDVTVSMRFALAEDAKVAAELSWKLFERLVEKRLDRPGFVVSFTPTIASEVAQDLELAVA
jgi:hypothetical protein